MIFSISSVTFGGKYLCVTKVGSKLSFDGKKTENPKTIVGGKFLIYTFKNNSGLRYVKSINKENSYYICAPEKLMEKNFMIENKKIEFTDGINSYTMGGVFSCRSSIKRSLIRFAIQLFLAR